MKVLQVIPYFSEKRGGDVNVCYNISKQLVNNGHEVTILTTDFELDGSFIESIRSLGVKVILFPYLINIKLFLISPLMSGWLDTNIYNYDIIHLHTHQSYQSVLVYFYSKKYHKPYVLHAHGGVPIISEKILLKKLYNFIFGYRILKNAAKLIANSNAEVDNYKKIGIYSGKIDLIYNGIDINYFTDKHNSGMFKEKMQLSNEYILFLGRIDKTKGLDFLVNSFRLLLEDLIEPLHLIIIGPNGNFSAQLDKIIQYYNLNNKIHILNFVDGYEKISAYMDAKIFVSPSSNRGGVLLTPIESILCGTPSIVTEEIGELFEKYDLEYTVKYGDINQLKDRMKYIIENPENAMNRVALSRKKVIENLDWNIISKKFLDLYKECINLNK